MGFDTIITNGRVVTATDTYASDVAISGRKDHGHRTRPSSRKCRAESSMPQENMFCRGESTCTLISTCPSAAPPAPTISRPAREPPPSAEPQL